MCSRKPICECVVVCECVPDSHGSAAVNTPSQPSSSSSLFSSPSFTSHQSPSQYSGQAAHHRQHHANIRPRRWRIRLENRHVPPAVFLATDGVTGVESRHAVAHLGQLGVLVRRRRDDGLVGRRRKRRSRQLGVVVDSGVLVLKLDQMLRKLESLGRC